MTSDNLRKLATQLRAQHEKTASEKQEKIAKLLLAARGLQLLKDKVSHA